MSGRNLTIFFTLFLAFISVSYAKQNDEELITISKTELNDLIRQQIEKYVDSEKKKSKLSWQDAPNLTTNHVNNLKILQKRGSEGINCAFDAILSSSHEQAGSHFIVKFDRVLTNVGNAYDRNTGIFQAPVSGTYLFSWTISADYDASIKTHLEKNGAIMASLHADGSYGNLHHFIAAATKVSILTLNAGDRVYIQGDAASRGTILSDNVQGHSGFSGALLFN